MLRSLLDTHLNNLHFHPGPVPSSLNNAKVIPVLQKSDPLIARNYRPISILPSSTGLFENGFLTRIVMFFFGITPSSIYCKQNVRFPRYRDAVPRLVKYLKDAKVELYHAKELFCCWIQQKWTPVGLRLNERRLAIIYLGYLGLFDCWIEQNWATRTLYFQFPT